MRATSSGGSENGETCANALSMQRQETPRHHFRGKHLLPGAQYALHAERRGQASSRGLVSDSHYGQHRLLHEGDLPLRRSGYPGARDQSQPSECLV